ncbi:MAG: tetratricopeptide repeat protein [Bryobacteraceae bacterium]
MCRRSGIFGSVFAGLMLAGMRVAAQTSSPALAHVGEGYRLIQAERWQEAAAEFRAALALDGHLARARYQLGICLFALGQREESRAELLRVARETGEQPAVEYYLGRIDLLSGNAAAAIARLKSITGDPPFPDTAFYLGCAYLAAGKTPDAIEWLRKAAAAAPHDFRTHYRLARALQSAGNSAEAEREYQLSTEAREHYNQAARGATECSQALKQGVTDNARAICRKLADPNDPDTLTMLGILYGEAGDYPDAIEPLTRAGQLDPDSFEVFHNLGLTYFRLRRFEEAVPQLERAVAERPDYFGSNALLGAALFMLKRDERAHDILSHAHQLNPSDPDTRQLLFQEATLLGARSYASQEYAKAKRYFEEAAALRPEDAQARLGATSASKKMAEIHK